MPKFDNAWGSYRAAQNRCSNTRHQNYAAYGGRGIKFLFASFEQFISEVGPRIEGTTLDRINNDGNYEPGNVRWATKSEQARNRRARDYTTAEHLPSTGLRGICKHGKGYQVILKGKYLGKRYSLETAIQLRNQHD